MGDPTIQDAGVWGAAAAAIIGGVAYLRKMYRADKSEDATSGLSVQMTESVQRVIALMQSRIDDLVTDVARFRSELARALQHNMDCENQNLKLTTTVKRLTDRVSELENKAP